MSQRTFFGAVFQQSHTRPQILLLLLVVLLSLVAVKQAAAHREERTAIRLQLPWTHQFEFAGFYVAKELGLYSNVGLDVEIVQGGVGILPLEECLTGRAQFGVGGSEIVLARLRGAPVVALASLFQHSAAALLVLEDSGIRQVQDLAGKRIEMGNQASDAEPFAMLIREGLREDSYTHVPSSFNLDNLLEGKVDAVSVFITNQPFQLIEREIPFRLLRPSAYGIDFYGDIIYSTEGFASQNKGVVRDFVKASLEGWNYALANPVDVVAMIEKSYQAAMFPRSREHLLYEYEQIRQLIRPDIVRLGHMNPGRFKHMAQHFRSLDLVTSTEALEGFIHDIDAEEPIGWFDVHVLSGVILVLFLVLYSWLCLRMVRRKQRLLLAEEKHARSLDRRLAFLEGQTGRAVLEWTPGMDHVLCGKVCDKLLGQSLGAVAGKAPIGSRPVGKKTLDLLEGINKALDTQGSWKGEWMHEGKAVQAAAWKRGSDSSGEPPVIIVLFEHQ